MGRRLVITLKLLTLGAALLALVALTFVARPEWFLGPSTLKKGLRTLAAMGGVHLNTVPAPKLSLRSLSLLRKQLTLKSSKLCADVLSPRLSLCLEDFRVEVELGLLPPQIRRVAQLSGHRGTFALFLENASEDSPAPSPSAATTFPLPEVGIVDVDFNHLRVTSPEGQWESNLALKAAPWSLETRGRWIAGEQVTQVTVNLAGQGNRDGVEARLTAQVIPPGSTLEGIRADHCQMRWTPPKRFHVLCPVDITLAQRFSQRPWARGWDRTLRLLARSEGEWGANGRPLGPLGVDVLPFQLPWLHGKAALSGRWEEALGRPRRLQLSGEWHVASFQRLRQLLEEGEVTVPAPLADLRGELRLATDGAAQLQGERLTLPFQLSTELLSKTQRFKATGEGSLAVDRLTTSPHTHLKAQLTLDDVRLALPDLDPTRLPQPFPDSRLRAGPPPTAAPSPFTYEVSVRTGAEPLRLLSNLANAPVPVRLDLRLADSTPPTGDIRLESFPVRFFRRNTTLKQGSLHFPAGGGDIDVQGALEVRDADYRIEARLTGTAKRPKLTLLSEPPLTEADIYSVLFFGRRLDELDTTEGDSVGQLQSAVSNRALGLASLYLLATTPIESVLYDPRANTFSARVRLAEGTSMEVGSDFKNLSRLGVRRKLGSSWILNSYVEDPFSAEKKSSVSALLEWSLRY